MMGMAERGLSWKMEAAPSVWDAWCTWLDDWWSAEGEKEWQKAEVEYKEEANRAWKQEIQEKQHRRKITVDWIAEEKEIEESCDLAGSATLSDSDVDVQIVELTQPKQEKAEEKKSLPKKKPSLQSLLMLSGEDAPSSCETTPIHTPTTASSAMGSFARSRFSKRSNEDLSGSLRHNVLSQVLNWSAAAIGNRRNS